MVKTLFRKGIKTIGELDLESLFWLSAFLYLAVINPYEPRHLSFCLFSLVGIENCPGCGLGKSISMIFHGDFISSFKSHPLGIPALVLITRRIFQLVRNRITNKTIKQMETVNG